MFPQECGSDVQGTKGGEIGLSTLSDYVIDKVDFFLQWNACIPLPLSFGNCLSVNTHAFQASEIIIWNGAEFQTVGIDAIPSLSDIVEG